MIAVKEEKRRLVAHEKLLIDVIKRQAGSLKKAILEGTMNSVEAGATEIGINFLCEHDGPALLSIYDDGIGIRTKKELTQHFETFGQPHEENENVIWKQFRMGRGQMFAFGKNTWRTSQFEMIVDVDNTELDYDLRSGLDEVDGCRIEIDLYQNPIKNGNIRSINALKEEVKEQVHFVEIPVKFNDEIISVNPNTLVWDYEDDNAYYLFNDTSRLKIYNLGVYVKSRYISDAGVGGIIVSKKRLDVNFARNDIQSTCKVYSEIEKIIQKNKIKKASKKYASISDGQRISLLMDLRDGAEQFNELKSKRIFKTAQGKWLSWNMLEKYTCPWCFTPVGNMSADKAMQMGVALCLDENIPEELGYTGVREKFFDWLLYEMLKDNPQKRPYAQRVSNYDKDTLNNNLKRLQKDYLLFDGNEYTEKIDIKRLKDMFSEDYQYIAPNKTTKSEKLFLQSINQLGCWDGRDIRLGISAVASAWTDGETFIAFDRSFIKKLILTSEYSLLNLFQVGCHEMAHKEETAGTHIHGPEFYERYYEITTKYGHSNPFFFVSQFREKMIRNRIENKRDQEQEKEQKAKEKLGIAACST